MSKLSNDRLIKQINVKENLLFIGTNNRDYFAFDQYQDESQFRLVGFNPERNGDIIDLTVFLPQDVSLETLDDYITIEPYRGGTLIKIDSDDGAQTDKDIWLIGSHINSLDNFKSLVSSGNIIINDSDYFSWSPENGTDGNYAGDDGEDIVTVDLTGTYDSVTITPDENGNILIQFEGGPTLTLDGTEEIVINGMDGDDSIIIEGNFSNTDLAYSTITLSGFGGADLLDGSALTSLHRGIYYGGSGDDVINGGSGNDHLYGEAGNDILNGNDGNDSLYGGTEDDTLDGGAGNDLLDGGTGNDSIDGGSGWDRLVYQSLSSGQRLDIDLSENSGKVLGVSGQLIVETDTLSNIEEVTGGDAADTIRGDNQRNILHGGEGNDIIYGEANNDDIFGDGGDDRLIGGIGSDRLFGGADNDRLSGGDSDDFIDGGSGIDWVDYSARSSNYSIQVNLNEYWGGLWDSSGSSQLERDDLINIENIRANNNNDTLIGNEAGNRIEGLGGNDWLEGRSGNDSLYGGSGNDTLNGGIGNDTIDGGSGIDWVYYLDYNPVHSAQVNLTDGWGGLWNFTGQTGVELERDTLIGLENILAGNGDDALIGSSVTNIIYAGGGDDWIEGRAGDDILFAQSGNDVINGGLGNDTLSGGSGRDTITYSTYLNGYVEVNLETGLAAEKLDSGQVIYRDTLSSIENVIGSAGNDFITGDSNNNVLNGLAGNDTFRGNAGNDTIIGGSGIDTLLLNGVYTDYIISGNHNSATISGYFPDGVDTLEGIEVLKFAGGQVPVYYLDGRDNPSLPPQLTGFNLDIDENNIPGILGTVSGVDPEGGAITYAVTNQIGLPQFSINSATGELSSLTSFNYEENKGYIVNISATDGDGLTNKTIVTININDVNEAPIVDANKIVAFGSDTGPVNLGIDLPVDPEGQALKVILKIIPENGVISLLDGTQVSVNSEISILDLTQLTFIADTGFVGQNTFSYIVEDITGQQSEVFINLDVVQASQVVRGLNLIGADGNDILIGSTDSDQMTGNAGADTFTFVAGDSSDNTIIDFNPDDNDKLDLTALPFTTNKIQSHLGLSFDGTNTLLDIDLDLNGKKDLSIQFNSVNLVNVDNDAVIADFDRGFVLERARAKDLADTGSISFSDIDLLDTHFIASVTTSSGTLGQLTAEVTRDTTFSITGGLISWRYTVSPQALDYLADGETKVEAFILALEDANGHSVDIKVGIALQGTNDGPVISGGDSTGHISEALFAFNVSDDQSSSSFFGDVLDINNRVISSSGTTLLNINTNLIDSGSINFEDVDLTDQHRISNIIASENALGSLIASVSTDTTGTGTGGLIEWTYKVSGGDVEYLAKDEVVSESFIITLEDDNGGVINQTIDISITGSNDKPWITAANVSGLIKKPASFDADQSLSDAGYIKFIDADLSDEHALSVSSLDTYGILTATIINDTTGTGSNGLISWEYEIAGNYLNAIAAGDTKIERFDVLIDDGNGGISTKTVEIKIDGGDIVYGSNSFSVDFNALNQNIWGEGTSGSNFVRDEFWGIDFQDYTRKDFDFFAFDASGAVNLDFRAGLESLLTLNEGSIDASVSYDVTMDSIFDISNGILTLNTFASLADGGGFTTNFSGGSYEAALVFESNTRVWAEVDPVGLDEFTIIDPDDYTYLTTFSYGEDTDGDGIGDGLSLRQIAEDIDGVNVSDINNISTSSSQSSNNTYSASGDSNRFVEYTIDVDAVLLGDGTNSPFGIDIDAGIIDLEANLLDIDAYAGALINQDFDLSMDGLTGTIHFVGYQGHFNTDVDFTFGETLVIDFNEIGNMSQYLDVYENLNYYVTMDPISTFSNETNLDLSLGLEIDVLEMKGSYDIGFDEGSFDFGSVASFNPELKASDIGIDLNLYSDEFDFNFLTADSGIFSIDLTENNIAPDAKITSLFIDENSQAQSLGYVLANDPDGGTLSYEIYYGNDAGLFLINSSTGRVISTQPLNHEYHDKYVLNYRVTDDKGLSDTSYLTININDINEAPVAHTDEAETNADAAVIINVSANDFDPDNDDDSSTLSYQLVSSSTLGSFNNNTDGTFTFNPGSDFDNLLEGETDTSWFSYKTTDSHGLESNTVQVSIIVTGVIPDNIAPEPYLSIISSTIAENLEQVPVNTVFPGDNDTGDSWSFAITAGNNENLFAIDANGNITTTGPLNFETTSHFDLEVAVTDAAGLTGFVIVPVEVANELEGLTITGFSTTINEDTPATSLGSVTLDNPDQTMVSYAITASDEAAHYPDSSFSINAATGEISTTRPLDFEWDGPFQLTVTATDSNGQSDSAIVDIALNDINEAPNTGRIIKTGLTAIINENEAARELFNASMVDEDANDVVTYQIVTGNEAGLFSIDANTGIVSTTGPLDYEAATSYGLDIEGMDKAGLSSIVRFGVAVNDVLEGTENSNPVVEADKIIAVGTDSSLVDLNITAPNDPDGDPLFVEITALPDNGVINLSDGSIVSLGTLSLADLSSLTFTPDISVNGTSLFTYQVSDDNGGLVSSTISMTTDSPTVSASSTIVLGKFASNNSLFIKDGNQFFAAGDGTTKVSINANSFVMLGSTAIFVAFNEVSGNELWKFNGQKYSLIEDLNSGTASGSPTNLTVIGDRVYFNARNISDGNELYWTDGDSIHLVQDIYSGSNSSNPSPLLELDGRHFFVANDGVSSKWFELSGDNITPVTDSMNSSTSYSVQFFIIGNKAYYVSYNSEFGRELFSFDGSSEVRLTDINPGSASGVSSVSSSMVVFGDGLFFNGTNPDTGNELYFYNVITNEVTTFDVNSGTASSSPRNLVEIDGVLYFFAYQGTSYHIWSSDGRTPTKLTGGPAFTNIIDLAELNGELIINGYDGTAWNIYTYDGNSFTLHEPPENLNVYQMVLIEIIDGVMHFQAGDGSGNSYYLTFDGISFELISNGDGHTIGSDPHSLFELNGTLYFQADDGNGDQVYEFDGVTTTLVSGSLSNFYYGLEAVGDKLYYSGDNGFGEESLWLYDQQMGTSSLIVSGISKFDEVTVFNNSLYFRAYTDTKGEELFWLDLSTNTLSGSFEGATGTTSGFPRYLTVFGDQLVFTENTGDGRGMWSTDGTNFNYLGNVLPSQSTDTSSTVVVGNNLYFGYSTYQTGLELWVYDGINPVSMVGDWTTGYDGRAGAGSFIDDLTEFNGDLYFFGSVNNGPLGDDGIPFTGGGLLKFDGVNLTEIDSAGGGVMKVVDGKLFYSQAGSIWSYDGNTAPVMEVTLPTTDYSGYIDFYEAGGKLVINWTSIVFDVAKIGTYVLESGELTRLTGLETYGDQLYQVGSKLYIVNNSGDSLLNIDGTDVDSELWVYDGTGTPELVKDININPSSLGLYDVNTLSIEASGLTLNGAEGDDILIGSSTPDTLTGNNGNDVLTGGSGSDLFVFSDNWGNDTIQDYEYGFDLIDLSTHTTITNINDLNINESGAGTVIDDNNGNTITLIGINNSSLTDADFLFVV